MSRGSSNQLSYTWHHVALLIPPGSDIQSIDFYLDGVLLSNLCSFANYGAPNPNIGNLNPIRFGRNWDVGAGEFFLNGKLDDIGIWNRALTSAEVQGLYTAQPPCTPTSSTLNVTIAAGQSYPFNGQQLATTGTYTDTLVNVLGCDSVITLNLNVTSCNALEIILATDANGGQTSWEIVPAGGGTPVCSGSGYASNSTITAACCLPNGCYSLRVLDSFGDGMSSGAAGGYVLRTAAGDRIIDNAGDGVFTALSQAPDVFCVPLGTDRLTTATCDQETVSSIYTLRAVENAAVSAQYGVTNSTSGYQFWLFDPDGTYSRRILLTHASPGTSFPTGTSPALRCSYLRLNTLITNPVPLEQLLNVRVRSRVAGTYAEFGPACRLKVAPLANCQPTQLTTTADPTISCGAGGLVIDGTQAIHANAVPGANRYQFRFTRPGYTRNIATTTRSLVLTPWATLPLQPGLCYDVVVRSSFDAGYTWCAFGPPCQVCLAVPPPDAGGRRSMGLDNDAEVVVYPNPGDGMFTLAGELSGQVNVRVYDMRGGLVHQEVSTSSGDQSPMMLDLTGLAKGIYALQVQHDGGSVMRTVVVE
jgi:hypothetical protein